MALVINRSLKQHEFFFYWGFVMYKCSSVVSDKLRAQDTSQRYVSTQKMILIIVSAEG